MKRPVVRAAGVRAMLMLGLVGLLFGATSTAAAHKRIRHSTLHCVVVRRHHHGTLHCTRGHRKTTPAPTSSTGTTGTTTTTGTGGTGSSGGGTGTGTGSGSGGSSGTSTTTGSGSGGTSGSGSGTGTITTGGSFSYGELQDQNVGANGCGTNLAGEPAIHVSRAGNVFLGSELGVGGGSELWRGLGLSGGSGANGCSLEFRGQPNAVAGAGASGGDIDIANASAPNSSGNYNLYVASLNLGSVNVATSTDNGTTFTQVPVQNGIPVDDREWIAAFGASTSLLTYHDILTNNIDVLRSDDGGQSYSQISQVFASGDYRMTSNQHGNLVIDHVNLPDSTGDFYAYQSFVAPSDPSGTSNNEAFLAVSADGGHSWTIHGIPCSTSSTGSLDHNFPNVSVAPNGDVWYAWSDDHNVYTAESTDHGSTWTCSPAVSTNTAQAIFPWLAATSNGVDLVYYASPTSSNQTWYVYFAQSPGSSPTGWGTPEQLMAVHQGAVCETGANCTSNRQLFDDFGVDTDSSGWAHIAYSHDGPNGTSYTGYAVQTSGTQAGAPNN